MIHDHLQRERERESSYLNEYVVQSYYQIYDQTAVGCEKNCSIVVPAVITIETAAFYRCLK